MSSRQATVLEVDKVLVVAQRRCKDLGVSVVFDENAPTAYTDGQRITLPYVGQPITKELLDVLYGEVIHETGHHLRPSAFRILRAAQPPEHLCALYNIVEDDGMERERAQEWLGDAKALSIMNSIILQKAQASWKEKLNKADPSKLDPAPLAAMLIGQKSRLEWDDYSGPHIEGVINAMPKEVQKLVNELTNEGWVRKFQSTTTPRLGTLQWTLQNGFTLTMTKLSTRRSDKLVRMEQQTPTLRHVTLPSLHLRTSRERGPKAQRNLKLWMLLRARLQTSVMDALYHGRIVSLALTQSGPRTM
jgi:hypothetical protein